MAVVSGILAILGPTASGKSALSLEIARQSGAVILSADSMQVYRRMDIGTAKPTPAEQTEVSHVGIDLVNPDEEFTVARFVELADATIANASALQRPLVVTGGTPLYYKALFEGLFEGPGGDEVIRERLRAVPSEELHAQLKTVDPVAAERIHLNDRKRMVRALEVFELTGQPISSFQTEWESPQARHPAKWIGLHWEKEALNRRINARVKWMIAAGWVEEVAGLLRDYPNLSKTAAGATGYADLIQHVRGKISVDEAIEQIKIGTRQLARRQMKWFRRFPNVTWLEGDRPLPEIVETVKTHLSR